MTAIGCKTDNKKSIDCKSPQQYNNRLYDRQEKIDCKTDNKKAIYCKTDSQRTRSENRKKDSRKRQ